MAEDDGLTDLEALQDSVARADAELKALQERGMGQGSPRLAGLYRPSASERADGSDPYIRIGWNNGEVVVLQDSHIAGAAENNLTAALASGSIVDVPYTTLIPYRVLDVASVVRRNDGMFVVHFRTVSGTREVLTTADELSTLHGFANPSRFPERHGDVEGVGVRPHALEGDQYTIVLPAHSQRPEEGMVLVPDPVEDTVAGTNQQSYVELARATAATLISADVLSGREGSYFVSALRPLDIPFARRKVLETAIEILSSKVTIVDGEFNFSGLLGGMNRKGLQSALGITELTVEGVQSALAGLISEELKAAQPEQLQELIEAMYGVAQARAKPVDQS